MSQTIDVKNGQDIIGIVAPIIEEVTSEAHAAEYGRWSSLHLEALGRDRLEVTVVYAPEEGPPRKVTIQRWFKAE